MQSSDIVLYNLSKQGTKKNFQYDRLYRNLYNHDFYLKAFSKLSKTKGTSFPFDEAAIHELIQKLINSLKDESYQPTPVQKLMLLKKKDQSKIGVSTLTDEMVQEVCRMILEAIYEPTFSKHLHSFREKRNCHTALLDIKACFPSVSWFIEGKINGCYDKMDHQLLINSLRKRIKDEKFIRLIWKLLKAGYASNWRFDITYSGTPKGRIISPILANIYLDEFDKYIEHDLKPSLTLDHSRKSEDITTTDHYKNLTYVRYADTFLLGINGSKEDCVQVKKAISDFVSEKLHLVMSEENLLITHHSDSVNFLGYDISIDRNLNDQKEIKGVINGKRLSYVKLRIPKGTMEKFIVERKMVKDIDAKKWTMLHRTKLVGLSDLEIINIYNAELKSLYHYYCLAENVNQKMKQLHYVMEVSCLKTLASKYKSTVKEMKRKYSQGKYWGIPYETKHGMKIAYFYKDGFEKKKEGNRFVIDKKPTRYVYKKK